jgi:2-dehydro-3-deoxyphosphogluconate aldolase/(4S)-4-hydroxy-2-oxoglutarate aldolase
MDIFKSIPNPIVASIIIDNELDAEALGQALYDGGIRAVQINLYTDAAIGAARRIMTNYPDITVGIGNVQTEDQVTNLAGIGFQYGLSTGLRQDIVQVAKDRSLNFIPGIMTQSESEVALSLGCKLQSFLSVDSSIGLKTLEVLSDLGSYNNVKFIPFGDISLDNLRLYTRIPQVVAIGCDWIATRDMINNQDWSGITAAAREAIQAA